MIQLRNRLPALQLSDFSTRLTNNDKALYGFERRYQQQRVRVILNNSDKIRLTIPAKWGAVLLAQ